MRQKLILIKIGKSNLFSDDDANSDIVYQLADRIHEGLDSHHCCKYTEAYQPFKMHHGIAQIRQTKYYVFSGCLLLYCVYHARGKKSYHDIINVIRSQV